MPLWLNDWLINCGLCPFPQSPFRFSVLFAWDLFFIFFRTHSAMSAPFDLGWTSAILSSSMFKWNSESWSKLMCLFFPLVSINVAHSVVFYLSVSVCVCVSYCLAYESFIYTECTKYDPQQCTIRSPCELNGISKRVSLIYIQTCLIKQSTIESFQTPNAIYVSTCVWHTAFCIHVSFLCCFFHFFFFFFGPVLYAANLNLTYSCENDFNLFIVGAFVAEIRAQL